MAIGNPLLVVWYADGTLRLFEYAGGSFAQIASTGGFEHLTGVNPAGPDPFPPQVNFVLDSSEILFRYNQSTTNMRLTLLNTSLAQITNADGNNGFNNSDFNFVSDYIESLQTSLGINASQNRNSLYKIAPSSLLFSGATPPNYDPGGNLRCVAVAPDASVLFVGRRAPDSGVYFPRDGTGSNDTPLFPSIGLTPLSGGTSADVAAWSKDSVFLCTADLATGITTIWHNDAGELSRVQEISAAPGVITSVAFSFDKRTLAIGRVDGSNVETTLYHRDGLFFTTQQVLPGIGRLLNFSYDGKLLVDARAKSVYSSDLASPWAIVPGAADAIFISGVTQALSTHVAQPLGRSQLYDGALTRFIASSVDLANLHLILLTDAATFNPTDTTVSAVTNAGAYAVSSGGYPGAGVQITGVVPGALGVQGYSFTASPVSRTIINEALVCRAGLVYDATSGLPVMFCDFGAEVIVPRETVMAVQFRAGNMLVIGQ